MVEKPKPRIAGRYLRVIGLIGASIYLTVFSITMELVALSGGAYWHTDYLLTHGEPFLVGLFALAAIWALWNDAKTL